MLSVTYRDLTTLEDFASVVELEREIWGPGYDEVVPVPILAVTVMRGGILIGAFDSSTLRPAQGRPEPSRGATASGSSRAASGGDGDRMIGFVYSLAGIKHGKPTQWSHMAGVLDMFRGSGVGYQLKVLQRERALAMGLGLVEWTYDPLQALNAHLNFARLGVVVEEYEVNVYGESSSPLHKGNPTDRFVAEWFVGDARVEERLRGAAPLAPVLTVEPVGRTRPAGEWLAPAAIDLAVDAKRISVEIPIGFSQMLSAAPDLALEWRMTTRELFTTYFARGYRAVEFFLDREARKGAYLLSRQA
jgi:predicted GNAT superfamily acetyltransferase